MGIVFDLATDLMKEDVPRRVILRNAAREARVFTRYSIGMYQIQKNCSKNYIDHVTAKIKSKVPCCVIIVQFAFLCYLKWMHSTLWNHIGIQATEMLIPPRLCYFLQLYHLAAECGIPLYGNELCAVSTIINHMRDKWDVNIWLLMPNKDSCFTHKAV